MIDKFRIYKKVSDDYYHPYIYGLVFNEGFIKKFIEYNIFDETEEKIPDDYFSTKLEMTDEEFNKFVNKTFCGNKIELKPDNYEYKLIKETTHNYEKYFIFYNYTYPFLVYVKNNNVIICSIDKDNYYIPYKYGDDNEEWKYTKIIDNINCKKVFIGNSPKNKMTLFSGGHGTQFYGNTILLYIDDNKYIFIIDEVVKFQAVEEIKEYYSPLGNNEVPYPIALSDNYIYYMLNYVYAKLSSLPSNLTKDDLIDSYYYIYNHSIQKIETLPINMTLIYQ